MLPKPDSCRGCPFYQTGQGFVPDELRPGVRVFVLGQNPGEKEEAEGKPFIGPTGEMMEAKFFPLAGLDRSQVSIGNAIRCRLKGRNELPPIDEKIMREAVEHCTRAHLRVPEGTELVIAQGEKALYAATGRGLVKYDKLSDWRGWVQSFRPLGPRQLLAGLYHPTPRETAVLATYHLAAIYRDPQLQLPSKYDWSRVAKVLAGTWPERLPAIKTTPPSKWPKVVAFDTEFVPETRELIRLQLAWRELDGEPQVYVIEAQDAPRLIQGSPEHTVIMHNTEADREYLDRLIAEYRIEDTMYAHAVLWSDFEHDLGYLGSIQGRTNRWKHLSQTNPLIYAGADALVTYDVWHDGLAPEFVRDPQSEWIYRTLKLPQIDVIAKTRKYGLRVNQEQVKAALADLETRCEDAEAMAQAAVGWPMNLGSGPQVIKQLYEIEQVHIRARRR